MKWLIMLAAATVMAPVAAHAQTEYSKAVGTWNVSGSGGDCLATIHVGNTMLGLISPASSGENQGGIALLDNGWTIQSGEQATLAFTGSGWSKNATAFGEPKLPGFFYPFDSAADAGAFPDRWHLDMSRGGTVVFRMDGKDFKSVAATLRDCVAKTGKAAK